MSSEDSSNIALVMVMFMCMIGLGVGGYFLWKHSEDKKKNTFQSKTGKQIKLVAHPNRCVQSQGVDKVVENKECSMFSPQLWVDMDGTLRPKEGDGTTCLHFPKPTPGGIEGAQAFVKKCDGSSEQKITVGTGVIPVVRSTDDYCLTTNDTSGLTGDGPLWGWKCSTIDKTKWSMS